MERTVVRIPVRRLATVALACAMAATASAAIATTAGARGSGPPVKAAPPTIRGKTVDGSKLRAGTGKWSGSVPIVHAFVWERCDAAGVECEPIAGAVAGSYRATPGDVGHELVVVETATNGEGSDVERSAPSATIAALAPKRNGRVTPSGETVDGRVLSAGTGTWKGTPPFRYGYQWYRCTPSCQAIEGATNSTYRTQTADVGKQLRAVITATNSVGSATQRSRNTTRVLAGSPLNLAPPKVSGTPLVGQTLTAEYGTWVGTGPIEYGYQWYACSLSACEKLAGQTEQTHAVGISEFGDSFEVEVSAANAEGTAAATSEQTNLVGGEAPANSEAPSISGEPKEGQLLTASSGKWSGTEPIAYEYEWLRCDTSGASCSQAAAASLLPTYSAVAADVGKTLRVEVIAKNVAGTASAESEQTETVKGVAPANVVLPVTVPTVTVAEGGTVTATEGTWTGTQPIAYAWEWKICTSATSCKVEQNGTDSSFKVPLGTSGKKLRVNVIATNAAGEGAKEALELTILL